jgi:anti-sigma28 factor (negative regulator of flagellin synthesis)
MDTLRIRSGEVLNGNSRQEKRPKRRPRSMTTLKLQWVAERVRKARHIKKLIESGQYNVDTREVAKALIGLEAFYKEEAD